HLIRRQLQALSDLLEDLRVNQLGAEPLGYEATHSFAARPVHPADRDHWHRTDSPISRLLEVVSELLRTRGMAELAQRLGLDLSTPLPPHAQPLPDLLHRPLPPPP